MLIITGLLSLSLIIFGISVLIRNSKEPLNLSFFLFSISVAFWLLLNYLSADTHVSHRISLLSNRLVLIAGGIALMALLGFVLQLAGWRNRIHWWGILLSVSGLSWLLCLTPFVVVTVKVSDGQVANVFGSMASVYFATLLITFISIMGGLIGGHYRVTGVRKVQLDTILKSLVIVIPVILVCNALLPLLGNYIAVSISPLSVALIVFAMYYVVAVHRLFDIRAFVFRAVAYALSSVVLGMVYVGPIIYVLDKIISVDISIRRLIVEIVASVFIATNFGRIKKQFDKYTSKVFFRDMYDSAELLGRLNRQLVSTTNLQKVLQDTADLITVNIKAEFCAFILNDLNGGEPRLFSFGEKKLHASTLRKASQVMKQTKEKILVTDYITSGSNFMKDTLMGEDIAVIVRFSSDNDLSQSLGFMLLGYKKSGNPYDNQDILTLNSIADVLVIAIMNALNYEEIKNFTINLQKRVDEATRKLRRTNAKLIALDETKDDFISMASHQLRTPLTSVKGYLSMVLDGDAGTVTPMQRKMLDQAFVSSQRMVYLIADLLNVSRLRTGKFVIEPSRTNLAKLVTDEIKQLQETAKSHALKLDFIKPAGFPDLMLDETKIRQVIMNFIDNAIYYTPSGGRITIELMETPVSVKLFVRDSGIGVPKGEQQHLFTKFYRAGNARRARPDGTGLGLFMAKKVIVASGGSVIFESKEGEGSTFGFVFAKETVGIRPETQLPAKGDKALQKV